MRLSTDPLRDPEPLLRRVYAYVAYRVGNDAAAEDIVGATFERAVRYRSSYDARRGEPIAWLIGIARQCILDSYARPPELAVPDVPEVDAPGDHAEETVRRVALGDAVAALPERDRELLALRYGADLSSRRIGELLDLKTNAVEVALHRALGRLRAELAEDGSGGRRSTGPEPAREVL